ALRGDDATRGAQERGLHFRKQWSRLHHAVVLVTVRAALLAPDAEQRQELHPRLLDPEVAHELQKPRARLAARETFFVLYHGHYGRQAGAAEAPDCRDDLLEGAPTAHGIVLFRRQSIERNAQVE